MKKRAMILVLVMVTVFANLEAGVKGAAAGAGIGAAVGHLVGGNEEAWIGAALGAAGGALIESNNKKFEKEIEAENMARRSNTESIKIAASEPKVVKVVEVPEKKADTWGMRSDEEIKERMEREKENLEAWNSSL